MIGEPGALIDAAANACAAADPTADAAVESTAIDTVAPPAGSPPDSQTRASNQVSDACELYKNRQAYWLTIPALSAPAIFANRVCSPAGASVVEMYFPRLAAALAG